MSNTNNNLQSQTSNALHNAIMEAGRKDRPPMLAPGNYVQWKSRIKRYIDTKPNNELIHYCLQNPPYKFKWTEKTVPVAEGSFETTTEGYMENYKNVSQDIRDQLNAKADVVQIILTWIDNDIYSTIDACPNACEMWKAIESDKAIVNSPPPTYDQEHDMVAEDDEMSKEKEIDKLMDLISLSFKKIYEPTNNNHRTSSNTSRAHQDNTPRINRGTGYDNQRAVNVAGARENVGTQKPKRVKDVAYHKEKMLLCKQKEAEVQLNAKQADWKDGTDDEPDDQELEARYMYMAQIQEVTLDVADNSGPIFDVEPLQKVQNDDDNYIVFDNDREHPEQPESVNEPYHDDTGELAKERDLLASLIEKLKCEIDDSKNRNKFLESSNKALVDKLKDMKKELFAHQETISIMSQEKEAQTKFHKTRDDKELKKIIALENKIKVLDNIVYKTGQSVQTINMLNRNCKMSFVKPEFLTKAQRANPRLYDIGCYNDNLVLMLAPESDETIRLA
ncbi:hypothetical protein Tco_1184331 [Tanacetum coccineum]